MAFAVPHHYLDRANSRTGCLEHLLVGTCTIEQRISQGLTERRLLLSIVHDLARGIEIPSDYIVYEARCLGLISRMIHC